MDTISLKKYIYENSKIEFILEEIGCHSILYHPNKEYYSCANYNGNNTGAVNVKNNEYLSVVNWTREKEFDDNSDIISLVQYNKDMSFPEAVKYLHKILDLKFEWQKKEEKKKRLNPLALFEKVRNRRQVNVDDIHALDDKLLDDYVPMLHIDWVREGVMPWTRDKFGLAYSYKYRRVVIPLRHWLTGQLLGFNMRTTVENYEEFGIKKYYLTPSYQKSLNLYGLYENYEAIKKAGYVVLYEAEKSVLKRDSLNDPTGVALSGHSISDEQVRILWGLDVEIIVAMDKDVCLEEVWHICEKFWRGRKVSYIRDMNNILDSKDSPADACNKDFKYLFDNRIKYDSNIHNLYEKSLEKK